MTIFYRHRQQTYSMFYLVHYQNTVKSTGRTNAPTLKRYSLRYVLAFFHSYTCRSRICLIDSLRMGTHRAPSPCRRNRVPYHPFPEGSPATCRALCSVRREIDTDHSSPTHCCVRSFPWSVRPLCHALHPLQGSA